MTVPHSDHEIGHVLDIIRVDLILNGVEYDHLG